MKEESAEDEQMLVERGEPTLDEKLLVRENIEQILAGYDARYTNYLIVGKCSEMLFNE